jgi:hypothetical protein
VSTIKSSSEDLTLNADGSNEIKFQINAVEKASISSAGLLTSTTIDATALTGNLPAISGASLTGLTSAQMPTGSVIQFAGASGTAGSTEQVGDGSSYTSSQNSAAITIKGGTSSKVIIIVYQGASHCQNGTVGQSWIQRAVTGGATTQILTGDAQHAISDLTETGSLYFPISQVYIDTPAVAADTEITYSGRYSRLSGSNSFYYLNSGFAYGITIMEVAQ